jgi:hypothetical protein
MTGTKLNDRALAEHVQTAELPEIHDSPLLTGLRLEFGPVALLGRFFLKAAKEARSRGVSLSFGTLEELAAVNRQHPETWQSLLPIFGADPASGHDENVLCILGRNALGEVVATQAARYYDLSNTNLCDAANSLRLFYPALRPDQIGGKHCEVSAPAAKAITGRVLYSGGGWYRPDFRSKNLSAILPRISRAYGLTRWNSQFTVSFIREALVQKGVAARYGYTKLDWRVTMRNISSRDFSGAVVWMETPELVDDLGRFLAAFGSEIDPAVERRRA